MDIFTVAIIVIALIIIVPLVVITKGEILWLIVRIIILILTNGKGGDGFGGGKFSGGGTKRSF